MLDGCWMGDVEIHTIQVSGWCHKFRTANSRTAVAASCRIVPRLGMDLRQPSAVTLRGIAGLGGQINPFAYNHGHSGILGYAQPQSMHLVSPAISCLHCNSAGSTALNIEPGSLGRV